MNDQRQMSEDIMDNIRYYSFHSQVLIVQDGPLASFFGVSGSHMQGHTVGLLWTSYQPVAETSTYTGQHNI
jgi:hypothetical protein